MTTTIKILGQAAPAATTETPLYTVPASTSAVVSTFFACNRSASPASIRLAFDQGGLGTTDEEYVYYDTVIPGNDTLAATVGFTLGADDVVNVYASTNTISFSLFGVEQS